jgi:hypothetical protein
MHPARFLDRRDDPVPVGAPDLVAAIGGKEIQRGEIGEIDLRLIADLAGGQGLSASESRLAADGWDGGRYAAVQLPDGVVVVAVTAWDSESEASEAQRLFARWLPLRFRNEGAEFAIDGTGRGWRGRDGAGIVVRKGDRVLLVLGPDQETARRAHTASARSL